MAVLGLELEKNVFPAITACPACNAPTLYLFDDTITDGTWLYCNTCSVSGDILTFAAELWKSSILDAANKFIDRGLILQSDLDRELGNYDRSVAKRAALANLWFDAENQLWNHNDEIIDIKLRELGLSKDLPGYHGIIGVAHKDQVVNFCGAVGRKPPTELRENGPFLVFPYQDLPGRYSGALLVQYNEDFGAKRTFVPLNPTWKRRPDAGYFLLKTAILPVWSALRDTYVITADPMWVVKSQAAQIRYAQPLLPMCASYCGPEAISSGTTLHSVSNTPKFFHNTVLTPELVSQAANGRGYVCVNPAPMIARGDTPDRSLRRIANIRKAAKTWPKTILELIEKNNETVVTAFASRLTVDLEKLQRLFKDNEKTVSLATATRILAAAQQPSGNRVETKHRWSVVERDDAWYALNGKQIINARITIDKIVYTEQNEKYYDGRIIYADLNIPFFDSAKKIERAGLFDYAANIAAQHGLVLIYERAWNNRAHMSAIALSKPEIIHSSNTIGWDAQTSEFKFQTYSIKTDGSICAQQQLPLQKSKIVFPDPSTVAPISIQSLLGHAHETAFIWNVFSVFLANIFAPVICKPYCAALIAPGEFLAAQQIGAVLNCAHKEVTAVRKASASRVFGNIANGADWPTLVSSPINDAHFSLAVPRYAKSQLLVRSDDITAAAALSYGWYAIHGPAPGPQTDYAALAHIVPAYVAHVMRTRFTLAANSCLPVNVLNDIHHWLAENYGNTFNLDCAKGKLLPPETAATQAIKHVVRAINAGELDLIPRPRRKDQKNNYLLCGKNTWWINKKAVDRYFYNKTGLTLNWLPIIELLASQKVFYGEETINDTLTGILIDRNWCEQFLPPNSAKETG